jgi:hypothetical protein
MALVFMPENSERHLRFWNAFGKWKKTPENRSSTPEFAVVDADVRRCHIPKVDRTD